MKRLLQLLSLIIISSLWSITTAQDYGWEMEMKDFRQTSEAEFKFDVFLRKSPTSPSFGLEVFQFQILLNPEIKNGGEWANAFLTVDDSETDLVGDVAVMEDFYFTTNGTVIQFASESVGPPGSIVTVFEDDSWKKVATFTIQISNGGQLNNFGDANPELRFRSDPNFLFTVLNRCNYTGTAPNYVKDGTFATQVDNRILYPADGIPLVTRQLAGYWFSGDGYWNENARWNNAVPSSHPANHQQPGANSNAIINGNATIPAGLDVSMLPDINGNGGELTVLTGKEPLSTIILTSNNPGEIFVRYRYPSGTGTWTANAAGYTITGLPAGVTIDFRTATFEYSDFMGWASNAGGAFINVNNPNFATYTVPANDATVTAVWDLSSKGYGLIKNSMTLESAEEDLDINLVANETQLNPGPESINSLFASLTVSAGATLTVDKLYNDNENGALAIVLQSLPDEVAGSLIHNNAGVKASVERYLESEAWHYVSSPISNGKSNIFLDIYLMEYLEETDEWFFIVPTNVNLVRMKGYAAWADDDLTGSTTVSYKGFLNVGSQNINLTHTTGIGDGYNFVGNPYASAIDWDAPGGWTKTNLDDAIYLWKPSIGNYGSYAGGMGTNGATGIIPSGQGMIVHVSDGNTTGVLGMNMSARLHDDQEFWKNGESLTDYPIIRLSTSAEINNYGDEILIRFLEEATAGFDSHLDAYKLSGTGSSPQFYSVNDEQLKLSMNAMPEFTENLVIPLCYEAGADGLYSIDLTEFLNFPEKTEVILEDKLEKVFISLTEQDSYSFNANISDDPERFNLHFLVSPESAPEFANPQGVHIFGSDDKIYLQALNGQALKGEVKGYDITGRLLVSDRVNNTLRHEVSIFFKGVMIVTFANETDQQLYNQKVFVR